MISRLGSRPGATVTARTAHRIDLGFEALSQAFLEPHLAVNCRFLVHHPDLLIQVGLFLVIARGSGEVLLLSSSGLV